MRLAIKHRPRWTLELSDELTSDVGTEAFLCRGELSLP
jgi:hypothetical protein